MKEVPILIVLEKSSSDSNSFASWWLGLIAGEAGIVYGLVGLVQGEWVARQCCLN